MSLRGEVVTKRDNVIKLVGTNFQNKSQEKAVGGRTCQRKMRSTWTPSNFVAQRWKSKQIIVSKPELVLSNPFETQGQPLRANLGGWLVKNLRSNSTQKKLRSTPGIHGAFDTWANVTKRLHQVGC